MRSKHILAVAFLCGCGGTGVPTYELALQDTNFTEGSISGRIFSGDAVSTRAGEVYYVEASAQISSALSAEAMVDGDEYSLINLEGTTYQNSSGTASVTASTRLQDGPVTPDVLYFTLTDNPVSSVGGPRTSLLVDGNHTSSFALPSSSARFSGVTSMYEGSGKTANGEIILDIDFQNNELNGVITGSDPSDPDVIYSLQYGEENHGDLFASIDGPNVVIGYIDGEVYGDDGDQAAGTLLINRTDRAIAGFFSAVR